jgi:hypothetical protein
MLVGRCSKTFFAADMNEVCVFLRNCELDFYHTVVFEFSEDCIDRHYSALVNVYHANLSIEWCSDACFVDHHGQLAYLGLEYFQVGGSLVVILLCNGFIRYQIFQTTFIQ